WIDCNQQLDSSEKGKLLDLIYSNSFDEESVSKLSDPMALELIKFYQIPSKDIITPGNYLYELKKEYDMNPTQELRRKKTVLSD
ncbi:MAG: hypothetical protein ACRC9Q_10770, partial [Bacteroidales bacterium]